MVAAVKNSNSIDYVVKLRDKKKAEILKAESYIADCELRIEQIRFEKTNQIKIETVNGKVVMK